MLLGIFAALALGLAAIGIYGVISYTVAQRTQEIGVRMALGATSGKVQGLVLKEGVSMALIGIAIGVGGALIATRLLAGILYGVSATDPVTFVGLAGFLTGIAILASYLPARKASTIEPTVALRAE
jgi:ABC-type antimicrobial peptide transport system permease subunit